MAEFSVDVNARVDQYLPVLVTEMRQHWKDIPQHDYIYFAGQVEQETCPSLSHRKCWNPKTELKTSREYGFGLGQLTITPKYDNFKAATKLHSSLSDWKYEDRYNPSYQLRTMVYMNKVVYNRLKDVNGLDRYAMTFVAYNGGLGGLLSDRRICSSVKDCNPSLWFGHTEKYSLKAKTKVHGYGKSFFEINREYPRNIIFIRSKNYIEKIRSL